jgi:hypothetical protein
LIATYCCFYSLYFCLDCHLLLFSFYLFLSWLPLIAVFFLSISVLIATYCCFHSLYFCLDCHLLLFSFSLFLSWLPLIAVFLTEIDRKKTAISGNQDRNRENENSNKWQSRQK